MTDTSLDTMGMDAPSVRPSPLTHVLVASTGEPFDRRVLDGAVRLAGQHRPVMHVVSIARIWGTALGLQNPGLYPTKREWQAQADLVADAVKDLTRRGFQADGRVIGSRHPGKAIARAASDAGCQAIVMASRRLPAWRRFLQGNDERGVVRQTVAAVYAISVDDPPGQDPRTFDRA